MVYKNWVHTTKRTPHFTIKRINWIMMFKNIFAVYNEKNKIPIKTKCRVSIYCNRWDMFTSRL
jgi:hypothetical protein